MNESPTLLAARKGMGALDAHQKAHPGETLDFSDVDFQKPDNAQIDFSGFEFCSKADFRNAKFGDANARYDSRSISAAKFVNCVFREHVNFDGSVFGPRISFEKAVFKDSVWFQNVTFGSQANFKLSIFRSVLFNGSILPGTAVFSSILVEYDAEFLFVELDSPVFDGASFNRFICRESRFTGGPTFKDCIFSEYAFFQWVTFGVHACFDGASFNDLTEFKHCQFGDHASFQGGDRSLITNQANIQAKEAPAEYPRIILDRAQLSDPSQFRDVSFYGSRFTNRGHIFQSPFEEAENFSELCRSAWQMFVVRFQIFRFSISHPQQRKSDDIKSGAIFSNRTIVGPLRFNSVTFEQPPDFHGLEPPIGIDLANAEIHFGMRHWPGLRFWTTEIDVIRRLKRIRSVARESDDLDLERSVFALQRIAERALSWRLWWDKVFDPWIVPSVRLQADREAMHRHSGENIGRTKGDKEIHRKRFRSSLRNAVTGIWHPMGLTIMATLYHIFSDFGRSIIRPTVSFFLILFLSAHWYSIQADPKSTFVEHLTFSLANAFPFSPIMRNSLNEVTNKLFPIKLFPNGVPSEVVMFSVGQTLLESILLFLIVLALRNHFRIR